MKTFKKLFIFTISLIFLVSCEPIDELIIDEDLQEYKVSTSFKVSNDAIIVAPSGDLTGVTDADNIEDALNTAKSTGGTVFLTDGDKYSTDHYFTSRNIVVDGFNGTLTGEGKNNTIINAGRKSATEGFAPAYSPIWTYLKPWAPLASTVLQLDNSIGDVTIKNLTILIKDDQPTDIQSDFYGSDGTYLWSMIEIIGGEFNTIIENVNLEGKESSAYGNSSGINTGWGIHVMPWAKPPSEEWPFQPTKGNLTINKVTIENIGNDAVLIMDYKDGSEINITDVSTHNVGYGVAVARISDSFVNVSNVATSNHDAWWATGLWFDDINSGLKVTENEISNAKWFASAFFYNVHESRITKNKFVNVESFGAAIALSGASTWNTVHQNDFRDSNLPGWTTTYPDGPGAIFLRYDTLDNTVLETKFPNNGAKTYCEMILDYGDNIIKNWQPCENLGFKSSISSKKDSDQPDINVKLRRHYKSL
jgi:Right handed beta helix region